MRRENSGRGCASLSSRSGYPSGKPCQSRRTGSQHKIKLPRPWPPACLTSVFAKDQPAVHVRRQICVTVFCTVIDHARSKGLLGRLGMLGSVTKTSMRPPNLCRSGPGTCRNCCFFADSASGASSFPCRHVSTWATAESDWQAFAKKHATVPTYFHKLHRQLRLQPVTFFHVIACTHRCHITITSMQCRMLLQFHGLEVKAAKSERMPVLVLKLTAEVIWARSPMRPDHIVHATNKARLRRNCA